MKNDNFYKYMSKVQQYPKLNEEELRSLFKINDKDTVMNDIILRNMQFVCWLVLSWKHKAEQLGIELKDLAGAGNIGLIKATMKYLPSKGSYYRYVSRYVTSFIAAEFCRHLSYSRTEVKQRLRNKLSLNPTNSLCTVVAENSEDEPLLLEDVISHKEDESEYTRMIVENLLANLARSHKGSLNLMVRVMELRYAVGNRSNRKPLSLSEAAAILHLSKEGVRKIEQKALEKLRL